MCGICGVIQVAGEPRLPVRQDVLDQMTDLMTHRGPNDRGTYLAPGVALGVRRLSIVDLDGGHQPFSNEREDVWAIQNGELYNHREIRADLESSGHRFESQCDTEVLPHLYERDGGRMPVGLRGMFAFAVWDGGNRRAVLARDRLGIKPLYVARAGDVLVFASELKSVLASGLVESDLDLDAIDAYLTFGFFVGPTTPLKGVRKVLPGHRLVVENGQVDDAAYWELPYPSGASREAQGDIVARLEAELDDAVRLRLMSDVPLGVMLSGGLDSSLVAGLMARHTTAPIKTFSVGFVEDHEHNELADARLVASALGAEHHELELSFVDDAVPLEELAWHLDEPLADLSSLGFHALSQIAAREVTVALAGQGADELFGGYPGHRNAAIAARMRRLPGLAHVARRAVPLVPKRYRRAARVVTTDDPALRFVEQYAKMSDSERRRIGGPQLAEFSPSFAERLVGECLDGHAGDPLASTLYLYQQFGLVDDMLHYFDRTSMAHSLEVRVPFLDHHVVELAAGIPSRMKIDWRLNRKALLRRVARGLVPEPIIEKRKIGFFSGAIDAWFARQMDGRAAELLLEPSDSVDELLDATEVRALVRAVRAGDRVNTRTLLALLMLKVWLVDTLPRALGSLRAPARV